MENMRRHTVHNRLPAIHDSTFFFVGPFDDSTLYRGPQIVKPINTTFFRTQPSPSKTASAVAVSPVSDNSCFFDDDDDSAILGDDEGHSEDELPRSPRRRHSGAMSISSEELPFCYDRDALKRDTAAHRERHHHRTSSRQRQQQPQPQPPTRRGPAVFVAHEQWDSEVDGPSMALWVPESQRSAENCKRRRVDRSQATPVSPGASTNEGVSQYHSSELEGPMMALWGI